jgi:hypothetical protein
MLGISLYRSLCLKQAKILSFFYYLLCFSSTKLEKRAKEVLPGCEESGSERDGWWGCRYRNGPTMYTHINKCINKYIY